MAQEITLPASFGKLPAAFKGADAANQELGAGVASSYAVMGYRGKVWMMKWGGVETQLMREDGDGPRHSIEVVIVKVNPAISKIFYRSGYVEGSNAAPDCWSANGIAPDPSVIDKVNPTCGNCPMNAWGSRTTDAGKNAKACADSRRTAIVPLNDIDNIVEGQDIGPMLLRVPAASLKDLKAYGDLLSQHSFPYYAAGTKISFDTNEAFPKFEFTPIRPLTDDEAKKILSLRDDKRVSTVLAEIADPASVAAGGATGPTVDATVASKSAFEQKPAAEAKPAAKAPQKPNGAAKPAAAPAAAAKPASQPAPKPAPKAATPKPAPKPEVKDQTVKATPEEILAAKIAAARKRAADAQAAAAAELAALVAEAEVQEEGEVTSEGNEELGGGIEEETTEEETTEEETTEEATEEEEGSAPAEFDNMLENLLRP